MAGFVNSVAAALGVLPYDKVPIRAGNPLHPVAHHEITDAIPALKPLYASWELDYDPINYFLVSKNYWWVSVVAVILYALGILVGTKVMENRKAFDLRPALALWNLMLSAFSTVGAIRTMPMLFYNLYAFGLRESICTPAIISYGQGTTGLWVQLFIWSKIPELMDTLFIVLRKRKLVFLHWYHHITVLLFCWHSFHTESPVGLYFTVMNYTVHGMMYGYYFLAAVNKLPKWFPPIIITLGQIMQMVVGVTLIVISILYYFDVSRSCDVKIDNLIVGGLMYASYFALFLHFAVERYVWAPRRKAQSAEKKSK